MTGSENLAMLVLLCGMSSFSPVTADGLSERRHGACQPVSIPQCADLSYNHTILPNLLGHNNQEEAARAMRSFEPLLSTGCSAELTFFLCAAYVPVCTVLEEAIPPCRGLCESVRRGCAARIAEEGVQWPDRFQCEGLPVEGSLCVGNTA
ncbi:frizzled-7-like [Nerophis ophidion]|nr:frizzled-7-like [Nerophis ophidion]